MKKTNNTVTKVSNSHESYGFGSAIERTSSRFEVTTDDGTVIGSIRKDDCGYMQNSPWNVDELDAAGTWRPGRMFRLLKDAKSFAATMAQRPAIVR